MRPWLLAFLLAVVLPLAGCLGDDPGPSSASGSDDATPDAPADGPGDDVDPADPANPADPSDPADPVDAPSPADPDAPRPAANASFTEVLVKQVGPDAWRASRWHNVSNDHPLPRNVNVRMESFEGNLTVTGEERQGYALAAYLWAQGTTAEEARRTLDSVLLRHEDQEVGNRVSLSFEGLFDAAASSGPVALSGDERFRADLSLRLPDASYDLRLETVGHIQVDGGLAGSLTATAQGSMDVTGAWTEATVNTRDGDLRLRLEPHEGSGRQSTATATASARGGNLTAELPQRAGVGYDITARSRGQMAFDLAEVEIQEERGEARVRSERLASANHVATLNLNGANIRVASG